MFEQRKSDCGAVQRHEVHPHDRGAPERGGGVALGFGHQEARRGDLRHHRGAQLCQGDLEAHGQVPQPWQGPRQWEGEPLMSIDTCLQEII